MAITQLHIENFKGIRNPLTLDLKPLNFFIGPNSSGKSSCIHALAALSQTVKIPNNTSPLLLDDEFAYVHLGRFIEVVHTKSYSDAISIGISCDSVRITKFQPKNKITHAIVDGSVNYSFKSTKRTQEIHLDNSEYVLDGNKYSAKLHKNGYIVTDIQSKIQTEAELRGGFLFTDLAAFTGTQRSFTSFRPLTYIQRAVQTELRKVNYLGPFRQPPSRRYPTRGSAPKEVGSAGEATITLLANEVIQSRTRKHLTQIQSWLKHLGLGTKIDVSRVAASDLFDVSVSLDDGSSFPLSDLGFGVSQVLPVLTQCSFAETGSTLLFEQPEIHLHSLAAKRLLKVFIDTVKEKEVKILAETHSPDIIHQLQSELRSGSITPDQVAVYRVIREKGCSSFQKIKIEDDCSIYENWEKGISRE